MSGPILVRMRSLGTRGRLRGEGVGWNKGKERVRVTWQDHNTKLWLTTFAKNSGDAVEKRGRCEHGRRKVLGMMNSEEN